MLNGLLTEFNVLCISLSIPSVAILDPHTSFVFARRLIQRHLIHKPLLCLYDAFLCLAEVGHIASTLLLLVVVVLFIEHNILTMIPEPSGDSLPVLHGERSDVPVVLETHHPESSRIVLHFEVSSFDLLEQSLPSQTPPIAETVEPIPWIPDDGDDVHVFNVGTSQNPFFQQHIQPGMRRMSMQYPFRRRIPKIHSAPLFIKGNSSGMSGSSVVTELPMKVTGQLTENVVADGFGDVSKVKAPFLVPLRFVLLCGLNVRKFTFLDPRSVRLIRGLSD